MDNKLEYIPGDLVMTKTEPNDFTPNGVVCEFVSYCNRNKVFVRVAKGVDTFFLEKEQITPIPLTPEILEKNGWYGVTYSKQSDDTTNILYKTFKRKGYPTIKASQDLKITCELSPFIVKLESVSDLQHLLFGLGINHEMEV